MNRALFNSKVTRFFKQNSSTILTILGVCGVVVTSVEAVKSTPKAIKLLDEVKKEKGEDLTVIETVITAAPVYIPSLIFGGSTIACIIGANVLNKRQQASLMSAYAFVENSYQDYKNKVKELYGEETHQNIINSIAQEKVKDVNLAVIGSFDICRLEEDDDDTPRLFYDEASERYFESTLSKVISAEYHFNRNFAIRGYACLNELYDFLGISKTDTGNYEGWSCEDMITNAGIEPWIDFNHRKVELEDGLICYVIEIPYGPSFEAIKNW